MAIGTPQTLGKNKGNTISSLAITTTNSIAAGDLVVVFSASGNSGKTVTSITDTAGNTYVLAISDHSSGTSTSAFAEVWYCLNAKPMASGNTITVTLSGSTTYFNAIAARVSGVSAHDSGAAHSSSVSTNSPSVSTGTLAQASSIVFGALWNTGGGVFTEASGFTSIDNYNQTGASTTTADLAYKTVSSTSSVTYAPTLTGGNENVVFVAAFKEANNNNYGFNMPMLGM